MKSICFSLLFLFISLNIFAQEPADALRYSYLTGQGGTARNQAIGGAGASLGGEFTSLFLNPAGLGYYKTGDFIFSPTYRYNKNEASYLGNGTHASGGKLTLNTTGLVIPSGSNRGKVRNVTVGLGFNRLADFNNSIYYHGINNNSSYSEKYLEELINDHVTDANNAAKNYPFGASMAFNTYLIDTLAGPGGEVEGYQSMANPSFGLDQTMDIQTKGGITVASVGVGINLLDKWYFGGSVSFPFLKYRRDANYTESDLANKVSNFNYFEANETLETKGVGINAKLGVIYSPSPKVRLGFAFHSPTFYQLTDLYNLTIITDLEGYAGPGTLQQSSTDLNDGNMLRSKYNMSTPMRAMLSGTYFISTGEEIQQQKGFITADVEYVDYKQAAFHSASDNEDYKTYYKSVNEMIDNMYKSAVNARIGAELKFNTLMVRFGGGYYGNPYIQNDASTTKFSGGFGYRSGGFFVDITYTYAHQKDVHYPYVLQDKPNYPAMLNNVGNYFTLTAGVKL